MGTQTLWLDHSSDRRAGNFFSPKMENFMGRPCKPTAILTLNGYFKKHPDREQQRRNEPIPSGPLGDPPSHFSTSQREIWTELARDAPANVLTNADRWISEIACVLMAKWRTGEASAGEMTLLMRCLRQMGVTPSARSSVRVPEQRKEKDNVFARIAAQRRNRYRGEPQ